MFSWFAFFRAAANPQPDIAEWELDAIATALRGIAGVREARLFTPAPPGTVHPFPDDEPAPMLALQLHFASIAELEASLTPDGALALVAARTSLRQAAIGHQAMVARPFPVPDRQPRTPVGERPCSYLVHYPGAAEDLVAWHRHYLRHHPPLMAQFPGVREIEIYSRLDWVSALPWPRLDAFQRNKLVFDTPAALGAGLMSSTIRDMRADFRRFPAFTGGNVHYPMTTRRLAPEGARGGNGGA
jgi:hypothetical protein